MIFFNAETLASENKKTNRKKEKEIPENPRGASIVERPCNARGMALRSLSRPALALRTQGTGGGPHQCQSTCVSHAHIKKYKRGEVSGGE
jgi:hypothetical protein